MPHLLSVAFTAAARRPSLERHQRQSFVAAAAGGVISNAADLATWINALSAGGVFNPEYQRRWLDSVLLEDPANPAGTEYETAPDLMAPLNIFLTSVRLYIGAIV